MSATEWKDHRASIALQHMLTYSIACQIDYYALRLCRLHVADGLCTLLLMRREQYIHVLGGPVDLQRTCEQQMGSYGGAPGRIRYVLADGLRIAESCPGCRSLEVVMSVCWGGNSW